MARVSETQATPVRALPALALTLLLAAVPAVAQEPAAQPSPTPQPAGEPEVPRAEKPPAGRFRFGPLWITPSLTIDNIGLDTNVFYTPTDRQTDVSAGGGPGLRIALPIRDFTLSAEGNLDYLYFVRTTNQRRLTGGGNGRLEWNTGRTLVAVQETYQRMFQRPSYEVDQRIQQEQWGTSAEISRQSLGKLGVRTQVGLTQMTTAQNQVYLGTDLGKTLTHDDQSALLGIDYWVTPVSSLTVEGQYETYRFSLDPNRDADSPRVGAGFQTDALFTGHAIVGIQWFQPKHFPERRGVYADVDLTLNASPRTRLGFQYQREFSLSAFNPAGSPSLLRESYGALIDKDLVGRLNLRLFGTITRLLSDGEISFVLEDGSVLVAPRDDTTHRGGANLGYQFRENLRIGVEVSYTDRTSRGADFGIRGLLVGATVDYLPHFGKKGGNAPRTPASNP